MVSKISRVPDISAGNWIHHDDAKCPSCQASSSPPALVLSACLASPPAVPAPSRPFALHRLRRCGSTRFLLAPLLFLRVALRVRRHSASGKRAGRPGHVRAVAGAELRIRGSLPGCLRANLAIFGPFLSSPIGASLLWVAVLRHSVASAVPLASAQLAVAPLVATSVASPGGRPRWGRPHVGPAWPFPGCAGQQRRRTGPATDGAVKDARAVAGLGHAHRRRRRGQRQWQNRRQWNPIVKSESATTTASATEGRRQLRRHERWAATTEGLVTICIKSSIKRVLG